MSSKEIKLGPKDIILPLVFISRLRLPFLTLVLVLWVQLELEKAR